jgi:hypothetical protein
MDPATAILLLCLCLGSFVALNLLYISIPYSAPGRVNVVLPADFWRNKALRPKGLQTEKRYAA